MILYHAQRKMGQFVMSDSWPNKCHHCKLIHQMGVFSYKTCTEGYTQTCGRQLVETDLIEIRPVPKRSTMHVTIVHKAMACHAHHKATPGPNAT
jgi:hypothetical protein